MITSDRAKVVTYRILAVGAFALWLLQGWRLLRGESLDDGPVAFSWLVIWGLYLLAVPRTPDARKANKEAKAVEAESRT